MQIRLSVGQKRIGSDYRLNAKPGGRNICGEQDCRSSRGGRVNSPVIRRVASAPFDDGAGRPRSGRFRSSRDTRNGFTATVADAVFWQEDARPVDAQRSIHISRRAQIGRNPVEREVGHYGAASWIIRHRNSWRLLATGEITLCGFAVGSARRRRCRGAPSSSCSTDHSGGRAGWQARAGASLW
jgi:hypothetical protein